MPKQANKKNYPPKKVSTLKPICDQIYSYIISIIFKNLTKL